MAQSKNQISWQSEEYIVHDHDAKWYIILFVTGAALCGISIWQQWWTFLVLIILSIITILTSNLRPPRKINYTLDQAGLYEDKQLHKYENYRAFGILKEGSHYSAILIPKKRFGLNTKIYFPKSSGEEIVDILGSRLPMEEVKLDLLDKIVNFLRI